MLRSTNSRGNFRVSPRERPVERKCSVLKQIMVETGRGKIHTISSPMKKVGQGEKWKRTMPKHKGHEHPTYPMVKTRLGRVAKKAARCS